MKPDDQNKFGLASSRFFLMPHLSPFNLPHFSHTNSEKYMKPNNLARKEFLLLYLKYVIPLVFLFTVNISQPKAQGAYFWSEPVLLFEVDGAGEIHGPTIISDPYGNVHVFWTVMRENDDELNVIYYMRQDAKGWTTPVDIFAADLLRAASATIGQDGFIYLIWNGAGGISYSRAPLQMAEFVKNWSEPILLADSNINAGITTSPTGTVHLAYPGMGTSGVFEQFLEFNDQYWSSSRTVSQTSLINTASDYVQIRVSDNGTIHVVWTEFYYPESWPPRGVFYSRSIDGGNTWSPLKTLGGDGFDQIYIAVVDDNNIHVAWNGMAGVGGRYHRWSSDGGLTWSDTIEVIPVGLGGTEGFPQLVVDQSGTVHMLTTHQGGCLWYTYLWNHIWIPPTCISGEKTLIEEPSMTVSEGNKLHAVFWDDRKSLWYTTKVTDAPWIPPEIMENEYLQPTQSPVSADSPVDVPTLSSTGMPVEQQLDASSKVSLNPGQQLILSLSPVILLVILIAVLVFFKKTR